MFRIFKFFIRASSFLGKELTEIFRQPRLILTLVFGPFLILLLFGFAYPNQTRPLRTSFVIEAQSPFTEQVETFSESLGASIIYQGIENDKDVALLKLASNQLDLVVVVPEHPMETIQSNRQAEFLFYHNEVDPFQVGYIQVIGNLLVQEINRRILFSVVTQGQEDAASLQTNLEKAMANAKALREALETNDINTATAQKEQLGTNLDLVQLTIGTALGIFSGVQNTFENGDEAGQPGNEQEILTTLNDIEQSAQTLEALDLNAQGGDTSEAIAQVADVEEKLSALNEKLVDFRAMEPGILIRPFTNRVFGLSELQFTPIAFFAPAVIVLLLQHLSVTFAALSIVRERSSGAMELFRVAPITAFETLSGKFLSYLVFEAILAAIFTVVVVWVLRVPMLGNWVDYALALGIVIFASLGLGFLISLISETEIQAVQYAMLLLLASIFFSGFFLDLRLMWKPITVLAWSLPATYGLRMLQDIMLRGNSIPLLVVQGLAAIGIVLFLINWILLRRKMDG